MKYAEMRDAANAGDPEMQSVALDNDERRLITAYRRVRTSEFADVIAKIHRKRLVAIYVTDKWHVEDRPGKLRENGNEE